MTIWILALILFICLGMIGYNQGAIRVAVSLIGIIVAAFLAMPLSPTVTPVIKAVLGVVSVKNPLVIWALAPLVVFLVILTLFKMGGFALHRKVEVHYKYKTGELVYALWVRLNKRLGACLGLVNALVYLLLLSVVIYALGYWTTQMAQGENDSRSVRWTSRWAKDLHATGLDKAARSIDPLKEDYYTAANVMGIVYHNPEATSRLSGYPAILDVSERPEFQTLANDNEFMELLQHQSSVGEVLGHPKSKAILSNPDLLKEIWSLLSPNLKDLQQYMLTGQSGKFDREPILGRWVFDLGATMVALKQSKTSLSATELKTYRQLLNYAFDKASFVATPSHQAILKDVIWVRPGLKPNEISTQAVNRSGEWSGDESSYRVTLNDTKELTASADNRKLKLAGEWTPLVFVKN